MKHLIFLTLVVSSLLSACYQEEGERCEMESDCASGLICCIPQGSDTNEGTCRTSEDCVNNKK